MNIMSQHYAIVFDPEEGTPVVGGMVFADDSTDDLSGFISEVDMERHNMVIVLFTPINIESIIDRVLWHNETCDWQEKFNGIDKVIKSNPKLFKMWCDAASRSANNETVEHSPIV